MTEHNINESTINENPEDKRASDRAAAEAHEQSEDIETTADADDRLERMGDAAMRFATETAYAAAGFAGLVGEKAKAFYDEQREQYAKAHPDEDAPSAKAFLDQLSEQINRFTDDLTRGYKQMAEKGREVVQRGGAAAKRAQTPEGVVNDGDSAMPGDTATFSSDLSDDGDEKRSAQDEVLPEAGKQDGIL